ncbi:hypothetical protein GCM10027343_13660 [Noviherbaspirillum agri]
MEVVHLNQKQLAARWCISEATLERWRSAGTFKVACPSDPEEAKDIVTILQTLDLKIDRHQKKREVLDELFESLLHKLMTGEIAVSDLDLSALSPASTQPEEATA